jgi:phage/plasmid-associated DNA primase
VTDLSRDFPDYSDQLAGISFVYPQIATDMVGKGWQVVWALYYGTNRKGKPDWRPLGETTGGKVEFPRNLEMPQGRPVRIAFRPPPGVKILDVDHYGGKLGWHTIQRAEEDLGTLPPTWKVTSRGFGDPSGRYLYRVRDGLNPKDRDLWKFRDPDTGATSVEVVRTDHRFSWAPGDVNPRNGELVQCYDPDGNVSHLPRPDQVPFLPDEWQDFLADAPKPVVPQLAPVNTEQAEWWLLVPDSTIGTRDQLARFSFELQLAGLSPDDTLAQLKRVSVAFDLADPWLDEDLTGLIDANTQEKVARKRAEWAEVEYQLWGDKDEARNKAVTQALLTHNTFITASESANRVETAIELGLSTASEPAREFVLCGIQRNEDSSVHVNFDPPAFSDQELAEAVLDRIQGARFCTDSKSWLVWKSEKEPWEEEDDILPWVITKLAQAMPFGNPSPDDEDENASTDKLRFKNRAYLLSDKGSRAVARKAASFLAVSGTHRVSYKRGWADADPEVLWAGGRCYDLRKSLSEPAEASVSLTDTPHLMTAPVRPVPMPVPGFEALLKAVLPDETARGFWLDMMALGVTGYSSKRTIPLGTGETKTGKTLLLQRLPFGNYLEQVSGMDLLSGGDREEARRLNILVGRRLPYIDEGIPKGHYALGRLKKISNGVGRLPARGIYGREYTFSPTHTLLILCNAEEEPSYQDDAVKDRICRVAFGMTDPKTPEEIAAQREHVARVSEVAAWYDPDKAIWGDEAPGVLWFMMRRAAQILAEGSMRGTSFVKPVSLVAEQDDVASQENPVQDWLTRCTVPQPEDRGKWTCNSTLHDHFLTWGRDRPGIKYMSKVEFGRKLTKLGVESHRPGGKTHYAVSVAQAWANLV